VISGLPIPFALGCSFTQKAEGARAEEFADPRLVRELDQRGFIKSLKQ
jgi:hypothetical protein